jgi:hypothetical protein
MSNNHSSFLLKIVSLSYADDLKDHPIYIPLDAISHLNKSTKLSSKTKKFAPIFKDLVTLQELWKIKAEQSSEDPSFKDSLEKLIELSKIILETAAEGYLLSCADFVNSMVLMRLSIMKTRHGIIQDLQGKVAPHVIIAGTKTITENDTKLNMMFSQFMSAFIKLLKEYPLKAPPMDAKEQEDYFEHFHAKNALKTGLANQENLISTLLEDSGKSPLFIVQLKQLKAYIVSQINELDEINFEYDSLYDIKDPLVESFLGKFHKCLLDPPDKSSRFTTTLEELWAYATHLSNSLAQYNDPTLQSQYTQVLRVINKSILTLREQNTEVTTKVSDSLLKLRVTLKQKQHEKALANKAKKKEHKKNQAEAWQKKYAELKTQAATALEELSTLFTELQKNPDVDVEELKKLREDIDNVPLPKQKKEPELHTKKADLLQKVSASVKAKHNENKRLENTLTKITDLFTPHLINRSLIRTLLFEHIKNPRFLEIFNFMFKEDAKVSDGSTASILAAEALLHVKCSPQSHIYKAHYLLAELTDISDVEQLTPIEALIIEFLKKDLDKAITLFNEKRGSSKDTAPEITLNDCLKRLADFNLAHPL